MKGSGTIRVSKRDGSEEEFQTSKLAGAMWRGIRKTGGQYSNAMHLAEAIKLHLMRKGRRKVSSSVLFEMMLKVLHRVRMPVAGEVIEVHRLCRTAGREALWVYHGQGQISQWDKSWLSRHVCHTWGLSQTTARIIAADVEAELLGNREVMVSKDYIVERTNACVANFGLADAVYVPVTGNIK